MKHGSLFSGIGGFDLAAEWMGWENIFHCEWNKFGQQVLKHHFPNSISYEDITKTDFTIHRGTIDILTGGFPCQPYSSAGKRLGKEDDRHLWPEMLRAIREIQPRWVVGENVRGLTNWNGGMVFDEVQSELEAEGYEVTPFLLPACAVNAPHRRDRIWFVAYSVNNRHNTERREISKEDRVQRINRQEMGSREFDGADISWITPYSSRTSEGTNELRILRCENGEIDRQGSQTIYDAIRPNGIEGIATNPNCNGLNQCNGNNEVNTSEGRFNALRDINESNGNGDVADTDSRGLERSKKVGWDSLNAEWKSEFGDVTDTMSIRLQQCEDGEEMGAGQREVGRERSQPTNAIKTNGEIRNATNTNGIGLRRQSYGIGESGLVSKNSKGSNWQNFPTQSPICLGNDGISDRLDGITFPKWRNESIKAAGNAIVPQVVFQIFKAIEQYDK